MARDFSARNDIDNSNPTDFPDGRLRDSSPPAVRNGTVLEEATLGDLHQFFLKLMREAGITPNGAADTDGASQFFNALVAVIRSTSATSDVPGTVERATQAEVNAGTDFERFVSPFTLAGRIATTLLAGIAELATQTEVNAGTDPNRIVTPATLSGRTATSSRSGIAETATQTEVNAGTDFERIVTPLTLAGRTAQADRAGLVELATVSEISAGLDTSRVITPGDLNQSTLAVLNATNNEIRMRTVDIGAWDMDTTPSVDVAHGLSLAEYQSIIFASAVIRNDNHAGRFILTPGSSLSSAGIDAQINIITATNVSLARRSGGFFDGIAFNDTTFSRGTITLLTIS